MGIHTRKRNRYIEFLLILMVGITLSSCSVRRYVYVDFSGNQNLVIDEEKSPTKENIWGVGKIPVRMHIDKNHQRVDLSVDENAYAPNVTIQSSSNGSENISEIENLDNVGQHCLSYKQKANRLSIELVVLENCSGLLRIKSLDSARNIVFTRDIFYAVKKMGLVSLSDGI